MIGGSAIGTLAFGAARLGADRVFRLAVGGEDVTSVGPMSFRVTDSVSARSTCDFALLDQSKVRTLQTGETVVATCHGARIFAGSVDRAVRRFSLPHSYAVLEVKCVDYNQLCDRFVVNQVFEDLTVKDIVTQILTDPETTLGDTIAPLSAEGITLGDVLTGVRIKKLVAGFRTVNDVFNELADASGLMWNIDFHKKLHFVDRSTHRAAFDVTDAQAVYRGLGLEVDRGKYRNRQILKAGKERTDPLTESFKGDVASVKPQKRRRTFNLSFPVGKGPPWYDALGNVSPTGKRDSTYKLPLRVKRAEVVQRLGVKGKQKDGDLTKPTPTTWPQWFYQEDEKEITQNSKEDETNNPTLANSEELQVEYTGTFPFVADVQSDTEIAARQALEGGSGEYIDVEEDESLDGSDFAIEKANRKILVHGVIAREVPYEYDAPDSTVPALSVGPGLAAGKIQTISISELGINALYLVDTVSLSLLPDFRTFRISVKALAGEHDEDPVAFFRRLVRAGQKITIRENEVVIKAKQLADSIRIVDTLTDSVNNPPLTLNPYTDDPYTFAVALIVTVGGKEIHGVVAGRSRMGVPYGV